MPEVPPYEALANEYEWAKTFSEESNRRSQDAPLASRLSTATRFRTRLLGKKHPMPYVRRYVSGGAILDVGCGAGSYLVEQARGFTLYGVDISPQAWAVANAAFAPTGGHAVCAPAHEALSRWTDNHFSAVILRSYLEHEHSPKQVLRELRRVLREEGVAVVKMPNYACINRKLMGQHWSGFRFPDHVNYFTPATLRALAEAADFKMVMRWRDRLPTSDNMWAVLLPRPQ